MKKLLHTIALSLALACAPAALAQAKKKEPAPAKPEPAAVDPTAKPAEKPADKPADKPATPAKAARPQPFNSTAEEVDAAGKSFTHVNKDGKKVKNVITDKTVFKGEAATKKFEDIKVGDTVNGSRAKKDDAGTEYEVLSVTFVGTKTAKPAPAKK
jgi:hypothetical protein